MKTIEIDRSDLTSDWLQSVATITIKSKLLDKVQNFLEKQEKVYLEPGEEVPEGATEQVGPKGGIYYIPSQKTKFDIHDPDLRVRMRAAEQIDQAGLHQMINDKEASVRLRVAERIDQAGLHRMIHDPDSHVRVRIVKRIDREYLSEMSGDTHDWIRDKVQERLHSVEVIGEEVLQYFEKFHCLPEELPESFTRIFSSKMVLSKTPTLVTKPVIAELYHGTPFQSFHKESIESWEATSSADLSGLLKEAIGRIYNGKIRFHAYLDSHQIEERNNKASQEYSRELVTDYVKVHKMLTKRILDIAFPNQEEFTVYRGTTISETQKVPEIEDKVTVLQNPLSSWTLKESVARKFAKKNQGIVLKISVSKDDIWSTFFSHAYEGKEREILVIGKPRIAEVVGGKGDL